MIAPSRLQRKACRFRQMYTVHIGHVVFACIIRMAPDHELSVEELAAQYRALLTSFTPVHRDCLQYVMQFMTEVAAHSEHNKVSWTLIHCCSGLAPIAECELVVADEQQ